MNRVKQLVHAENVYRMGYTGKNIRVVTLDTGVYLHPDLRQNVVGFLDFVAMKRACYDDNGHGTHVGGILCANGRMKGMAPQAQLIALKVLGKDGGGQTERVIRGLQWVLAHHNELGIRILNFSVGFLPGALDREQKQIMELMVHLQEEMGLSILFISHDLNVIYQMCDRVMGMKDGKIEEQQDTEDLFAHPKSSYTKLLL